MPACSVTIKSLFYKMPCVCRIINENFQTPQAPLGEAKPHPPPPPPVNPLERSAH